MGTSQSASRFFASREKLVDARERTRVSAFESPWLYIRRHTARPSFAPVEMTKKHARRVFLMGCMAVIVAIGAAIIGVADVIRIIHVFVWTWLGVCQCDLLWFEVVRV